MVLEVIRACARRWYIVLLGLIVTAALVYGAFRVSPPEYSARALVLLLPSRAQVGVGGNPFLELSGLEQPAGILAAYFSSKAAQTEIQDVSGTAEFQVSLDDSVRGPVLTVEVIDSSSHGAKATLNHLLDRIPEELARLQQEVNASPESTIGSTVLTVDEEPEAALAGNLRSMIAVMVVGLAGTGVSAYAFDGFMQRRAVQKRRRPFDTEGDLESGAPHDAGEVSASHEASEGTAEHDTGQASNHEMPAAAAQQPLNPDSSELDSAKRTSPDESQTQHPT